MKKENEIDEFLNKKNKSEEEKIIKEEFKNDLEQFKNVPPVKNKQNTLAEDIRLINREWLNPDHIRYKTEYATPTVAHSVSLFQSLGDRWNITCIKNYLNNFRTENLSIGRQTSKELVEILSKRIAEIYKEEGNIDKISKFLE